MIYILGQINVISFNPKCYFTIGLIKKMVQYSHQELLASLCSAQNENLGTLLVEVVASVLDNEVTICPT